MGVATYGKPHPPYGRAGRRLCSPGCLASRQLRKSGRPAHWDVNKAWENKGPVQGLEARHATIARRIPATRAHRRRALLLREFLRPREQPSLASGDLHCHKQSRHGADKVVFYPLGRREAWPTRQHRAALRPTRVEMLKDFYDSLRDKRFRQAPSVHFA